VTYLEREDFDEAVAARPRSRTSNESFPLAKLVSS
jgi:hypothetical protein